MDREKVVPVLVELLRDPVVDGFAVKALGKLDATEARAAVERHLNHPKAWIRRATKTALRKMDEAETRTRKRRRG